MDAENSPTASVIGCGMALTEEGAVSIVLMLGDVTNDGERTLGTIVLNMDMADTIVAKLQDLLTECRMAEEAVSTMGADAAREYLNNWARRFNAPQN